MFYKKAMGLSAFALATMILATDASAQQDTTVQVENIQPVAQSGGVVKTTFTPLASNELKKVKAKADAEQVTSINDLKQKLTAQIYNFNEDLRYTYNGYVTMSDIKDVLTGLTLDDYTSSILGGIQYGISSQNGQVEIIIKPSYLHTKAQEAAVTAQVDNIIDEIIKPGMTDIEKIKAINDYIVTHTVYTEGGTDTSVHSPYTIISEGKGVCQAYALLAYRLLEKAGIENRYVTGWATVGHAWNLIKLDGKWYHLDTTWNDPVFNWANLNDEPYLKNYVRYNYFLVSDQTIKKDHLIDPGYPSGATTDYFPGLASSDASVAATSQTNGTKYVYNAPVYIDDTWYFADGNYHMKQLQNGQVTTLYSEPVYGMTKVKDKIYFMNRYFNLTAYNVQTGEFSELLDEPVNHMKVDDDTFIASYNGKVLYTENMNDVATAPPVTVDKTALIALMEQAASKVELTHLLAEATAVVDNEDATEQQVAEMVAKLQQALAVPAPEVIEQQVSSLVSYLVPDFKKIADQLLAFFKQYESLGLTAQLPEETVTKIEEVQQLHQKMETFENTLKTQQAWSEAKTTKDAYKPWTVTLSTAVANSAANKECVKVYDMFGQELKVDVVLNGKKVTITPKEAYEKDVPYTLSISKQLTSQSGKQLKKDIYLKFTFEQ